MKVLNNFKIALGKDSLIEVKGNKVYETLNYFGRVLCYCPDCNQKNTIVITSTTITRLSALHKFKCFNCESEFTGKHGENSNVDDNGEEYWREDLSVSSPRH